MLEYVVIFDRDENFPRYSLLVFCVNCEEFETQTVVENNSEVDSELTSSRIISLPIRRLAEDVELLELTKEGGSFHLDQAFEVGLEGTEVRYVVRDSEDERGGSGREIDGEESEFGMMKREVRFFGSSGQDENLEVLE